MKSIFLACVQCDQDFEFTQKEQEKFLELGFDVPLRCPQCRKHKSKDNEANRESYSRGRRRPSRNKGEDDFYFQQV